MLDQVHFKKIYNDWISQHLYFFWKWKNFHFQKITCMGSKHQLNPTLVIFLTFFEKIYKCWIKCKLSKSQIKWTGLMSVKYYIPSKIFWSSRLLFRSELWWNSIWIDNYQILVDSYFSTPAPGTSMPLGPVSSFL